MYCRKCKKRLDEDARFCDECGSKAYKDPVVPAGAGVKYDKEKNMKKLIGVLMVIILCLVGFLVSMGVDRDDVTQTHTGDIAVNKPASLHSEEVQYVEKSKDVDVVHVPETVYIPEVKTFDMSEIESYISANTARENVAVSVIDNKTGERYNCSCATRVYSAWGFYLPLYLLNPADSIMSNDPGVCNSAANNAIDTLGGTASVTALLKGSYGVTSTSYGRKFGDVNAHSDNYTCASDAAYLLRVLNSIGRYDVLRYDPAKFGISAPAGGRMYSQLGTENISKKEKLNVFAIIKGNNSDYCVAILTENYCSSLVTPILNKIHTQMENL